MNDDGSENITKKVDLFPLKLELELGTAQFVKCRRLFLEVMIIITIIINNRLLIINSVSTWWLFTC